MHPGTIKRQHTRVQKIAITIVLVDAWQVAQYEPSWKKIYVRRKTVLHIFVTILIVLFPKHTQRQYKTWQLISLARGSWGV